MLQKISAGPPLTKHQNTISNTINRILTIVLRLIIVASHFVHLHNYYYALGLFYLRLITVYKMRFYARCKKIKSTSVPSKKKMIEVRMQGRKKVLSIWPS
ncbi:MAG: hypothetical protein JWQ96_425 [Segetibacter sp.]|nr:hypothetical protein [Segetibacter sp.]